MITTVYKVYPKLIFYIFLLVWVYDLSNNLNSIKALSLINYKATDFNTSFSVSYSRIL
jgi:hypothetical protein